MSVSCIVQSIPFDEVSIRPHWLAATRFFPSDFTSQMNPDVPLLRGVQTIPSEDVSKVPFMPTATNKPRPYPIPTRVSVTFGFSPVQSSPFAEENISGGVPIFFL